MPSADTNVLQVVELTKVFRDFWGRESVKALDALNFDVKRGEVFGLLGPNGSGKTTAVRIILGLLFPTRGAISLFGRTPQSVDVKKRVGYMPEESHLYLYLNAEETLDFFGRLFRLPARERRRRTEALIDMVGLQRARKRPVGQYSKGMARRIGLAQSLVNDPDFLILDEPTTGLDPIGTREIKDLILALRNMGKTILLCSHLLGDVEEVCDRICILYGGRQRALGPVRELLVSADVTQIRAPHLEEDAVRKIRDIIRESTGRDSPVEVSSPTKRLEEYFLNVVDDARRERLTTAGAEVGTAAASFLGAGRPEPEKLLDELVQAAREPEKMPEPAAQPAAAIPVQKDTVFIEELVRKGAAPETEQEAAQKPAVVPAPETTVRRGVLDELLVDPRKGSKPNEDKAS
jgi:ABC-2 type transport system ATP-binding protein